MQIGGGQASLEIRFNGVEMYLVKSYNYNARLLANNSFVVHNPNDCSTEDCYIDIYCYSNSTLLTSGAVIFPNGHAYTNVTMLNSRFDIEILNTSIHLVVPNGGLVNNNGIFTFVIPNSNGELVQRSFGLYAYTEQRGAPVINASLNYSGYTDLTRDASTATMTEIVCYSSMAPPTNVIWKRNGKEIHIDGVQYDSKQIVADRINSHCYTILLVKRVVNVIGHLNFTCCVSNIYGSATFDIATNISEAQHRDGDIRLVGGSYQWEGRVEIYLSGTWGTITDSQWTSDDAQAVCRNMGYFRPGAIQHTNGYFGEGSGPIHLDYVVCTGTEYNLMDCQIGSGTRDSSHSDDVGVKCNTNSGHGVESGSDENIDVNGSGSDLKSPESGMIIGSGNQPVPPDMMFDPVIESDYEMTDAPNKSFDGIIVNIVAVNDVPSDIAPLTPPLYRLTTILTLFCHVHGASGQTMHMWSRTSASNFTAKSTSVFNRNTFLTSADAGVYTCNVRDADRRGGQASLEIRFNGAEMYLVKSYNYNARLVANNSFVVHNPNNCSTVDCYIDIYCYSNSTLLTSGAVIFPNGRVYTNVTMLNSRFDIEILNTSIHLVVPNGGLVNNNGIFTFVILDSNGELVHRSFGLYAFTEQRGAPVINASLNYSGYTDLTRDASTATMTEIVCYSSIAPPTNVIWKRNGKEIHIDGVQYDSKQIVADRINSHYYTILLVKRVVNVIGHLNFTCCVSNIFGSATFDIPTNISVAPTIHISAKLETEVEGQPVVLDCIGAVNPVKGTAQFLEENRIIVEWYGPDGHLLEGNDFIIGDSVITETGLSRTVKLIEAKVVHTGLYTCKTTLKLLNNATQSVTSQYHLVLLKNLTISQPISEYNPSSQADVLRCRWSGGEIAQMEWLFLGNNIIVPMEYTNSSWNNEVFECTSHLKLTVKASFTNDVSIEASTEKPTAGENVTLTCTVISDRPPTLRWVGRGVGSEGSVVQSQVNSGFNSTLVIEFSPLYTSHGGVYTCVSSISQSPSAHDSQLEHSLRVNIPAPSITTLIDPANSTEHLSNTKVTLSCIIDYNHYVDTPVSVSTLWISTKMVHLYGSERFSFAEDDDMPFLNSTFTINSLLLSDSDTYTCIAAVVPQAEYFPTVLGSDNSTEDITLTVSLNVSVLVNYNPPYDFTLQTPPYYRPATSVSLTCIAINAVGPVRYTWSSTCDRSRCFAASGTSSTISKDILMSEDVGIHMCSVTDKRGNKGFATTEMKLYGIGIYYEHDYFAGPIVNNTARKLSCQQCQLDVSCYSNISSSATVIVPNGLSYSSYSDRELYIRQRSNSGIHFYYSYNRYTYSNPPSGVYTCRFTSYYYLETMEASVGVNFEYTSYLGAPNIISSSYEDYSRLVEPETLAEITCISANASASNVTWLRNGINVNTTFGYEESVRVQNRFNFELVHTLRVNDIAGVMGNNTYTCIAQNHQGQTSKNIIFDNKVSTIINSTKPFYGNKFVLKCKARLPPSGHRVDIQLQWFGPNGPLQTDNMIEIGDPIVVGDFIEHDAVFPCPTPSLNGVYTCQLKAYFEESNETLIETNAYYLKVLSKLSTNSTRGNIFPYAPGHTESIVCSWDGNDVHTLEWFLGDLHFVPISSKNNTNSLALFPDISTSGLNGTTFTCRATTHKEDQFEETVILLVKDVKVNIYAIYDQPPDFDLPSPPYYRPATSVTLQCNVTGATGPISYHWTSNSSNPLSAYQQALQNIRITRMRVVNSGLYVCTVTDSDEVTFSSSTTVSLAGGGIYVSTSLGLSSGPVPNNTALVPSRYFRSEYSISFYCSFNDTNSLPELILPNGSALSSPASSYGIRFIRPYELYFSYRSYIAPQVGIYSCVYSELDGNTVDMSVGIYPSTTTITHSLIHKEFNHSSSSSGSYLGTYMCETEGFPPTSVSWERNNVPLFIDGIRYSTEQIVTNRSTSSYKNILQVHHIIDLLGDPVFRCTISSDYGFVSGVFYDSFTVSALTSLQTSSVPVYNTQFDLMCQSSIPNQYIRHLAHYIDIEWSGPASVISLLESSSGETVKEETDLEHLISTLSFSFLNSSHNGNYTCKTVLRLPSETLKIGGSNTVTISVEAISVIGNEHTHIIGTPVELTCVGKDKDINRIEWISESNDTLAVGSDTNTLTLAVNSSSISKSEGFTCRTVTLSGFQQQKLVLVTFRELIHELEIIGSSERPVVGVKFTLVCTVYSDLLAAVTWFGHNQSVPLRQLSADISVTHEAPIESGLGVIYRATLVFHTLRASHGNVYTCKSQVNLTSTRQSVSQVHWLRVYIPPPIVSVSHETREVKIGSMQTLKCSVTILTPVDVPARLTLIWRSPSSVHNDSTTSISGPEEQYNEHSLYLVLDSYNYTDSGVYTCTTAMDSAAGGYFVQSGVSSSMLTLVAANAFDVSIEMNYNPPSDFSLPSPPYYRPASSITLTCVVNDTIGTLQYQWTSTENRSFAHMKNGSSISQRLLTAHDAGIHTCTINDQWGNTGTASTEMSLFGMGIYIEESLLITNTTVANNTHVILKEYCENDCKVVSFCCFSNITESEVVSQYPKKRESYYIGHYVYYEVDPWQNNITLPAGLCMSVGSTSYYELAKGTYTCEAVNSTVNGSIQWMSIGVYASSDRSSLYNTYYIDLTDDASITTLAVVACETRYIQPQRVSWLRNGELLSIDGHDYEIIQHLVRREGSVYNNSLVIRDVAGLINNPTYTCNITGGNHTFMSSAYITINLEVDVKVSISVSSDLVTYGDDYTLTCEIHTLQSKPTLTDPLLQRYLTVKWVDINDMPIESQGSLTVGELTGEFSRSLHFDPVSEGHDRLYTCVAMLNFSGFQSTAYSQYRLMLDTALLQLKFDPIPCTFLSEQPRFAANLEATIKDTLSDVINGKCNCNFTSAMISDGEFSCVRSSSITYRARIEGSSDTVSTELMLDTLQSWKRSYGTFLFSSSINLRLWVDPFCPLEIKSLQEPLCRV